VFHFSFLLLACLLLAAGLKLTFNQFSSSAECLLNGFEAGTFLLKGSVNYLHFFASLFGMSHLSVVYKKIDVTLWMKQHT